MSPREIPEASGKYGGVRGALGWLRGEATIINTGFRSEKMFTKMGKKNQSS